MAKIRVMGVKEQEDKSIVHIVLTKDEEVEGQPQELPLGESFVPLPHGADKAEIKAKIMEAAKSIMAKHREAQAKRKEIEAMEFPEVEE